MTAPAGMQRVMKFQAPKGTRDFYPQNTAVLRWIERYWREVSRRNGFVEYDGPILEDLNLYRAKSGDEIVGQLFHMTDRGGRELAIRPEMTPTLARMVAAKANSLARPIKWFSVPRLCRAERPQRGRLREFFQWNIDILGEDGEIADAECIFVAVDFFRSVGLSPDEVQVRINSRGMVASLLNHLGIGEDRVGSVYAVLDKRDKLPDEKFAAMIDEVARSDREKEGLLAIGDAKGDKGLADIEAMLVDNEAGNAHCKSLRRVFELLDALGVSDYCGYDMGVVRGLAYYTGMVFEAFGTRGLKRALCGGGRYDRLLSEVGGPPMGGVGFATSDVVIADLLGECGKLGQLSEALDFFVIDAAPGVFEHALHVVAELRQRGFATAFSYKRQNVGKQFGQASAAGAVKAVVVESDYSERRQVTVKDLVTGKQATFDAGQWLGDPEVAIR